MFEDTSLDMGMTDLHVSTMNVTRLHARVYKVTFGFLNTITLHTFVGHGYQNDLRDRCDGNIKMKLVNDEHAYALIVDFRVCILRVCLRVAL